MQLSDFHFELPDTAIAQYPLPKRSASRLLCVEPFAHRRFSELSELLQPGDLLVFNDTRVIPARLFARKTTGGQVEILVERVLDAQRILAQLRVSKSPRVGDYLLLSQSLRLEVINKNSHFYELRSPDTSRPIIEIIESLGQVPLPPYMQREAEEADRERYQTIYARYKGSVAAPTAGFHFDEELMAQIHAKKINCAYLTLHIGAGTFMPVRATNIAEHKMHAEYLEVSPELCAQIQATKANGKRVICVGTTSMRALETASQSGEIRPYSGETSIFIYPGYSFRCADALITNLHLPKSTLLMLVCAFGGYTEVMRAYQEAVRTGYRFYSYGDAMWMLKALKA